MAGDAQEWRGLRMAARASAAHALLFTFTLFLVLKLHQNLLSSSWWLVFSPLWLFHIVVGQGRFSIPVPARFDLNIGRWHPFHAVVVTPLLIAFELLLCIYLEYYYVNHVAVMNIHLVFLPVYLLESIIIIDNLRKWETDPDGIIIRFPTALSMFFTLISTWAIVDMTRYTLEDDLEGFLPSVGQFWAYIVIISQVFEKADYQDRFRLCIGSHVMIVPIYVFQVVLLMYLKGIPARARDIPIPYIFSPLFFLQGLGVLFSTSQLVERIYLLLRRPGEAGNGRYFELSSRARGFLEFMHHGSRFLGWWSIDEASKEEQARRIHDHDYVSGCSHPDSVKGMSKKDLVDEVLTLQAAISKQIKAIESTQQDYELLRYEKILCRICLEREIDVVLLPCKHRLFCRQCCWTLWKCPYCSAPIGKRLCDSQSRRQQKPALSIWMLL